MFTIDDDFDVDEDFLESTFTTKPCETGNAFPSGNAPKSSKLAKPLNDSSNLNHLNEEKRGNYKSSNGSNFLELWNSNDFFAKSPSPHHNPRNLLDVARAVSPFGIKSEVATRVSKNVVSRKFPGPAGLLPERTSNTSFIAAEEYLSSIENENQNFHNFQEKEVLSQTTNNFFEEPGSIWRNMIEDLGPQGLHLISKINLSTVRFRKVQFGFKVPFLAVFVQNIDCSLPDPSLLLKDQSGEMHGTLHRDVWEDWKGEIIVGSVMVLRNTGVITAGTSSRRHFLNITANNISTIYCPKNDTSTKVSQIQSVHGLNISQILDEWSKVMTQTRQQQLNSQPQNRHQLFSTFTPDLPNAPACLPMSPSPSSSLCQSILQSPSVSRPFTPPYRPKFTPKIPHHQQRQSPNLQTYPRPQLNNNQMPRPRLQQNSHGIRNSTPPTKLFKLQQSNSNYKVRTIDEAVNSSHKIPDKPTSSNILSSNNSPETSSKKLKMSSVPEKKTEPISSIFTVSADRSQSIVDSVLEGIDTNLLFDDF